MVVPLIDGGGLYFTFMFPAVLIAGLFGGTWSGISTALFGGLLTAYIWIPPAFSFALAGDGIFRLFAFWSVASMVILLTAFVHTVLNQMVIAETHANTIAREMQHRVRNSLTLVQAIARQTFRSSDNLIQAQEIFTARVAALGRIQDLIGELPDQDITIEKLIRTALAPFNLGQLAIGGPPVAIDKDFAVSLVLLIHELATNAVKYGAMSSAAGRVEISWVEKPGQKVQLSWKERYGPEVSQPSRAGFGTKLLRSAFAQQENADATIRFEPDGVRCTVNFSATAKKI